MKCHKLKNNIRWILFVPMSYLASDLVRYLLAKFDGGSVFKFFDPSKAQLIDGMVHWGLSAFVLIYLAYMIIPSQKLKVIKIYTIIWTGITIAWTILMYFFWQKGIYDGDFEYPLLLDLGFLIGLWIAFALIHNEMIRKPKFT